MKKEIATGYKIGGRTWISDAWNGGTLTKERIGKEITDWNAGIAKTDDDIRAELRVSEAWVAREQFEDQDDDDPTPYEAVLENCVERDFVALRAELDAKAEVADTLQELYDNWTDDADDDEQFDRVYQAHAAMDAYCRAMDQGEFCG